MLSPISCIPIMFSNYLLMWWQPLRFFFCRFLSECAAGLFPLLAAVHRLYWNHISKKPMSRQRRNLRNAGSNSEDWKWNKHIDGRIECQPMDKADCRRTYAAIFGWRMAAWFWIPKPLHSIANPSRRKHSCHSWCGVAAFSFIQKSREIKSRTEVQGHRIFFSEGKTGIKNVAAQEKCSAALSTEIASIGLCQP